MPPRPHPDHLGLHHLSPTSQPGGLGSIPGAGPSKKIERRKEPETINISDDDDETSAPSKAKLVSQPSPTKPLKVVTSADMATSGNKSEIKPEPEMVKSKSSAPSMINEMTSPKKSSVLVSPNLEKAQPTDLLKSQTTCENDKENVEKRNLQVSPSQDSVPKIVSADISTPIKCDTEPISINIKQEPQDTTLQDQLQPVDLGLIPDAVKTEDTIINVDFQFIAETLIQLSTSTHTSVSIKSEHVDIENERPIIAPEKIEPLNDDFNDLLKGIELYEGVQCGIGK